MEQNFKIIAIRPLKGCNKKLLRILTVNKVYQLYNNYTFKYRDDNDLLEVIKVIKGDDLAPELYKINRPYGEGLSVNISAIVGENGSGKSSIIELLYAAMYNLSLKSGVLPSTDENDKVIRERISNIFLEVYFEINYQLKKLTFNDNTFEICCINNRKSVDKYELNELKDLEKLFYTIGINFSHYALNSRHLGKWVESIFHKNDSYQTPLVLNPFRDEGKIDINNEDDLAKSRILSNILFEHNQSDSKSDVELLPNKKIVALKFKLNKGKGVIKFDDDESLTKILNESVNKIVSAVFKEFQSSWLLDFEITDEHLKTSYGYITKKLYNIQKRYKKYKKSKFNFITKNKGDEYVINQKALTSLVLEIKNDESHITFKIKQAINFILNAKRDIFKSTKDISIAELNEYVEERKSGFSSIEFIPPSFYSFDIKFGSGRNFNTLSSGEKQKVFSMASVNYHLYNLNSVIDYDPDINKYGNVNIIFDEIELYYHPEWQRCFINDVLNSFRRINIPSIKSINIIFVTHSPFILSDIPKQNILFLSNLGIPQNESRVEKTFGANIHELLKDSFFLENGYMGEFAKGKINETVEYIEYFSLNAEIISLKQESEEYKLKRKRILELDKYGKDFLNESNKERHLKIIELIGEDLLRDNLRQMYMLTFQTDEYIDNEITRLTKLKEKNKRI
jgi:predicted ATP-binding protein involved in virulence